MTQEKQAGFKAPSRNTPDEYDSYCWFVYPLTDEDGNPEGGTVRMLFPPVMRNDIYGGKTETEIRTCAFAVYNTLVNEFGIDQVSIEMFNKETTDE